MSSNRIIAVGLLTNQDLARLGQNFARAWPIDETQCFGGLLEAIDEADRQIIRDKDQEGATSALHCSNPPDERIEREA